VPGEPAAGRGRGDPQTATAFFALRRPGERVPVHRGGEVPATQRRTSVRAAEGLPAPPSTPTAPPPCRNANAMTPSSPKRSWQCTRSPTAPTARPVHAELTEQGRRHSRKRIARLMRAAVRRGRGLKRWRTTAVPTRPPVYWRTHVHPRAVGPALPQLGSGPDPVCTRDRCSPTTEPDRHRRSGAFAVAMTTKRRPSRVHIRRSPRVGSWAV
jgi:hypothetical protein